MAESSSFEPDHSIDLGVYRALEDRFAAEADEFIKIMNMPVPPVREQRIAIGKLGLTGATLYELDADGERKVGFYPEWLRATQLRLERHTADRPEDQELLRETIFFEQSGSEARKFSSMQIYGRIEEPYKTRELPAQVFAEKVLSGEVSLKF